MDRRKTVEAFRERLSEVIERSGLSRMAFSARVGLDRSTLSQLLSPGNERLPRAETIAAIAGRELVSIDWLLGLSQEGQIGADIMAPALEIESGAASPADERLARWHDEAAGYKIRYVPTTLPDLLKTKEVIRYEFQEYGARVPKARIEQAEERLAYSRLPETDMEACSSFQALEDFARGHGVWRGLPAEGRAAQLNAMTVLLDELYPTFRWFLFDGLQRYSVPLTIFGPKRVAVYVGNMYLVFNSTEHIQVLTRHFDDLIRAAVVQPPDVIAFLKGLLRELDGGAGEPAAGREK
ncbi:MAG: helix-turn-helix transcriptional regulator [Proteobacteria bacterium]|nr:helix-turn-helix transcriptional regulator [Pseudomonadota bacterium]